MARALFDVLKRSWFEDQLKRYGRREPTTGPVPGEAWYADPSTLRIQIQGSSRPRDEGTSVKVDPSETDLSKAFRPRPFLIVSNENVLNQGWAWVCPLSSNVDAIRSEALPGWAVPLPELKTFGLVSKLHSIDIELYRDTAARDLLFPMNRLSETSIKNVRAAIERHLDGVFAPINDPLPPGTIVRYANGVERMVIANCDLGSLYRNAGTLSTTCFIERAENVSEHDRLRSIPDFVPFPPPRPVEEGASEVTEPVGFVDLVDMQSELQSRLESKRVRTDLTALAGIRAAFRKLLLGEVEEA